MADFGVFADVHTLCFERLLAGTPERVWQHLTEPELLIHWLGLACLDSRAGGRLDLQVSDAVVSGTFLEYVCPRRLACSWHARYTREHFDGLVAFQLESSGTHTLLVFRHTVYGLHSLARAASQWHARLDALAAQLTSSGGFDQTCRAEQVFGVYAARVPAR
jgi:uncharacterized protein YndB with AHSA1/START domain